MRLALSQAVDYCVEYGMLAEFLRKYRAEVPGMLLRSVEAASRNLQISPQDACGLLGVTREEYETARREYGTNHEGI